MTNPKIFIKDTGKYGMGVFTKEAIRERELIASFDGKIYEAAKTTDLPWPAVDYAMQFSENKWRDSKSIARVLNHSCEPNCGIKNLFDIVTMRDILSGEELTWDYEMSEDGDWRMGCCCGHPTCRKTIGAFRNLPAELRERYRGYISGWLVSKYGLRDAV